MRKRRRDEFRVDMPDGLIIERLPIGKANDAWYLPFVCSGVDFLSRPTPGFLTEFRTRVWISDAEWPGWGLESEAGGSSGGDDLQFVWWRYSRQGQGGPRWPRGPLTALDVTYVHDGATVAREII